MEQLQDSGEPAGMKPVVLLGERIGYSLSPAMQNAAFKAAGLPLFYFPLSLAPDRMPEVIEAFRKLDFKGGNVTWPYKETVIPHMDALSPTAAMCRSVNTIVNEDGRLVGHSTDGEGFINSCRFHGIDLEGSSMLLLGAGGAARAVAHAAAREGLSRLILVNRTPDRAESLRMDLAKVADRLQAETCPYSNLSMDKVREAGVIVNATPVGLSDTDHSLIDSAWIGPGQVVHELVYHPPKTALMEAAEAAGASAHNGLMMLLFQGALSFRIWTGFGPPVPVMARALCRGSGLPEDRFEGAVFPVL